MRLRLMAGALAAVSAIAAEADDAAAKAEVDAVLASYAEAWNARDVAALADHWVDLSAGSQPVYIAEEVDAVFTDGAAVRDYWERSFGYIEAIELQFGPSSIKPLGEDRALVSFPMRWDLKIRDGDVMGGDVRAVAVMQDVGETWKLDAWVEAPLAHVVYLRKLNTQSVRPEFVEALGADAAPSQGD